MYVNQHKETPALTQINYWHVMFYVFEDKLYTTLFSELKTDFVNMDDAQTLL